MARRALLIGSQVLGLQAVYRDIDRLAAELRTHWAFDVHPCTAAAATRAGILAAYEQLISDTGGDDAALVYYAGHGSFSEGAAAARGLAGAVDQFIVPTDFPGTRPGSGEFRGITSYELTWLLGRLTDRSHNVTTIMDCCHSSRMSRGELAGDERPARGRLRVRAVRTVEWAKTVQSFVAAFCVEHGDPLQRYPGGNPHAVQISACQQDESAYESGDGGLFTGALLSALASARAAPSVTWKQLMARIRARVLRRTPLQRPDIARLQDRRLFSLEESDSTGVLTITRRDGRTVLGGGRLMGVERGDEYLIMAELESEADSERALARCRVTEVYSTTAIVEAMGSRPSPTRAAIPEGAGAFPVKRNVPRGAVDVVGEGSVAESLRRRIAGSDYLRLHDDDDDDDGPAMATVRVTGREIAILDGDGELWLDPMVADVDSSGRVLDNLTVMARAELLRQLQGGRGAEALDIPVAITWGTVGRSGPNPLPERGARVAEGCRVFMKVAHAGTHGGEIYVSIFDIGLAGKIALLSGHSRTTGMKIPAGRFDGFGIDVHSGRITGIGPLSWPPASPRGLERMESLLVVITDKPHDLTSLTGDGVVRGVASPLERLVAWIGRGGTRDLSGAARTGERYAVRRIDFFVQPDSTDSHSRRWP